MLSPLTVSYQEQQKDATYITVSSRPTAESEPGAQIVKSMTLRAAIAKGKIVRLGESDKTRQPIKPPEFEVNKFFRRLSFKRQVRSMRFPVSCADLKLTLNDACSSCLGLVD